MKKIGHIFIIMLTYLIGLVLLVILVYGSIPKADPDFLSAKEAFSKSQQKLEHKYPASRFYIWKIQAGSEDIFSTADIKFGKSNKWRLTFIKYTPDIKPQMEMDVVTLDRGEITGEGIFDIETDEKPKTLIPKLENNNNKLKKWKLDSNTIYYKNLFLAKERKYRNLRAIEINMTDTKPLVYLSFLRNMSAIEQKAFTSENKFILRVELTLTGDINEIKEYPVKI